MQLRNGKIINYDVKVKVIRKSKSGVPQLSLPARAKTAGKTPSSPSSPRSLFIEAAKRFLNKDTGSSSIKIESVFTKPVSLTGSVGPSGSSVAPHKPNLSVLVDIHANWKKAISIPMPRNDVDLQERIRFELDSIIKADILSSTEKLLHLFLYINANFYFIKNLPAFNGFLRIHVPRKIREEMPVATERIEHYQNNPFFKKLELERLVMLRDTFNTTLKLLGME